MNRRSPRSRVGWPYFILTMNRKSCKLQSSQTFRSWWKTFQRKNRPRLSRSHARRCYKVMSARNSHLRTF